MNLSPKGDSHKARQIKALGISAWNVSLCGDKFDVAAQLSH